MNLYPVFVLKPAFQTLSVNVYCPQKKISIDLPSVSLRWDGGKVGGGGRVGGNAYANLYAEKWGCGGFLLGEGEGRATRRPRIDTHNPQFLYWLWWRAAKAWKVSFRNSLPRPILILLDVTFAERDTHPASSPHPPPFLVRTFVCQLDNQRTKVKL